MVGNEKYAIMYLKIITVVVCFVLASVPGILDAQPRTNIEALESASERFREDWRQRLQRVRSYARENNVLVRQELAEGAVLEMIDVRDGRPVYYATDNINAAYTTRTDELWVGGSLGLSLDGSGYDRIGVWDGGKVRTTHQEFNNTGLPRVVQSDGSTSNSNHATHVTGTILAGGVSATAKGMAYAAEAKSYDWNSDDAEMASAAAAGMEVSNHSYGLVHGWYGGKWYGTESISTLEDFLFGFYSSAASGWDAIAYDAPYYLIVKSAGNDRDDSGDGSHPPDGYPDGYDCIGTQGIAKNILTVGAVADVLSYTGPASVVMSSFSGWGPADDGRIKPDIVGNGISLRSAIATSNSSYANYSGTSMSAPNVTGTLALLQQYYQNTHGDTSMLSSTLKALVINTADECGAHTGPDYSFGWGLLNAERAAQVIRADTTGNDVIQEIELSDGGLYTQYLEADGSEPITVTIVWTDPEHPGLSASLDPLTPVLIHDLDLRIVKATTTYFPYQLARDNPSAAATNSGENNVDNVESVFIESPAAGYYTIEVDHDGTLSRAQYFSLIIRGASLVSEVPPVAAFSYADSCLTVSFSDESSDADGSIVSYHWDFGDGDTSAVQHPVHTYSGSGTYTVQLTVTDDDARTDTVSLDVTLIAGPASTYYRDQDGDGYGNPSDSISTCAPIPEGYVSNALDCDDSDPSVNPAASEICNDGVDNNCDGKSS